MLCLHVCIYAIDNREVCDEERLIDIILQKKKNVDTVAEYSTFQTCKYEASEEMDIVTKILFKREH